MWIVYYYLSVFVTMDDNISPPSKKSKRQVEQVVKLQFIESYNVIELTYNCKKGRDCKTIGHTQR